VEVRFYFTVFFNFTACLTGLDEQPGSIQNLFLRRESSLTGLDCEGGGKSFPLVLLNIIFHKKLHLPFTLLGLVYHMDVR